MEMSESYGAEAKGSGEGSGDSPTERLRLLLFTNSVFIGGMEKHVEMIARNVDRSAVEVFTIVPQWAQTDPWAELLERAADHSVRVAPDRRYGLRGQMRDSVRLWRQLRRWKIQVMHMHLTRHEGGTWAMLIARLAGVRAIVCTEHLAPEERLPWYRRVRRDITTLGFDRIVCVSLKNRQARERHLYTPQSRTTVVNNGIDISPFMPTPAQEVVALRERLGIPEGALVVGTVVRLVEEKGLNYLFDALPAVLQEAPDTYLLIVGDGKLRGALEEYASALGIRERVMFAGFQSDPRPYLSLMNAFVLPVPFGSASIGLLEAMAMRRAVVITFGGDGEPVIDGVTGLAAPPRDAAMLAKAILRILLDPAFERQLGERARQRVETDFSSQSVATQLLALYRQVAVPRTRTGSRRRATPNVAYDPVSAQRS
jgi:glycosyltransferase involved in cell wall biosynthesis